MESRFNFGNSWIGMEFKAEMTQKNAEIHVEKHQMEFPEKTAV